MNPLVIEAIGILAAIIDLTMSIPQAWKLHKNKNAQGVSLTTWAVLYTTLLGWGTYGYTHQSIGLSIGFTIGAITIATLILPSILNYQKATLTKKLLTLAGIPAFTIPLIITAPPLITAVFLFLLTFNRIPQIIKSYRTYKNHTPTNVSILTWSMGFTANLSWLTYGILRNDPAIIAVTIPALFYDSTILTLEKLSQRKQN